MPNVFVFTIDQVASRSGTDQVPVLLTNLKDLPTVIPFSRTVGDEVQGVLDDPAAAVEVLRRVLAEDNWHTGIGIGPLKAEDRNLQRSADGTSASFALAREAVEAAKKKPGRAQVAVRAVGPDDLADDIEASADGSPTGEPSTPASPAAHLGALLDLWAGVVGQRTASQREIIAAANAHPNATQAELAKTLGMTQQGVAKSLAASLWRQERGILPLVERLFSEAAGT